MLLVYSAIAGTGKRCKNTHDEFTSRIFFKNKNGVDRGNISVFLSRTLFSSVLEILNWLVSDE